MINYGDADSEETKRMGKAACVMVNVDDAKRRRDTENRDTDT